MDSLEFTGSGQSGAGFDFLLSLPNTFILLSKDTVTISYNICFAFWDMLYA